MKANLLIACIFSSLALTAQDTTIVKRRNETITIIRSKNNADTIKEKHRAFAIGVGYQTNMLQNMGFFNGLNFTGRANAKNGRLAGILNLSYNLGNPYTAFDREYYFSHNGEPDSLNFVSEAKYNFLKVGLAIQVPLYNRTNKKGFSISAIAGASYYNGLGSGYYISYLDKATRTKQYFSLQSHNLEYYSFEIGLAVSYTISRYQIFADASTVNLRSFTRYHTLDITPNSILSADMISYGNTRPGTPNKTVTCNIGVRYCLYNPWQTKPPKRI